jgi:hypothetical protein
VIAPADSRPDVDALVEFRVDPDAQSGNVVAPLARLLIDLMRRQNERKANNDPLQSDQSLVS